MKKISVLLSIIFIAMCIISCNRSSEGTTVPGSETAPSPPPTDISQKGSYEISYSPETERMIPSAHRPSSADAGDVVTIRTGPVMEAELYFYYDNIQMKQTHAGRDYWEYQFIMPAKNITVSYNMIPLNPDPTQPAPSDPIPPQPYTLSVFEQWLTDITPEQITQIKTTTEYSGVRPGSFNQITYTSNGAVISSFLKVIRNLEITQSSIDNTLEPGGTNFTISFLLADGTNSSISFANNMYICPWLSSNSLKVESLPRLDQYEQVTTAFSFVIHSSAASVYDASLLSLICLLDNIGSWEFIALPEESTPPDDSNLSYLVRSHISTIYIYSDNIFRYEDQFYYLINGSFSEMFS